MTKMMATVRGGAAISIRSVTGIPIKFIGTGEKMDAIEAFQPTVGFPDPGDGRRDRLNRKAEAALMKKQAKSRPERLRKVNSL